MVNTTFHSDYSRFKDRLWIWESVNQFIRESSFQDGIHQIGLQDGRYFDMLVRGVNGRYSNLPVFFNGAVIRSNSAPPYFSGSKVAVDAASPVISIADPTLNLAGDLGIGWYTGGIGSKFDAALVTVLNFLRLRAGANLILVGGSAGGFAALHFAVLLKESALVWNPQIDFLKYNPEHVSKFLSTRFESPSWMETPSEIRNENGQIINKVASSFLARTGVESEISNLNGLDRLVYLQNRSDNHEKIHALPVRERSQFTPIGSGIYNKYDKTMLVAEFNEGHRAPSRELITYALIRMLKRDTTTLSIAKNILNKFQITV
ncbi:hypothetical protein [Glutamicibacter arilaitensis]|uniref:hypothetical protein n=1 Tax=Glutamicibacter arilaitensis TaxID=256701 RepID=UPI00384CE6CC